MFGELAAAVKRCHAASQAAMEAVLRPYGLGVTQWYVLHRLAEGPTVQRDLALSLRIEGATLSGVVSALVRKGFVEQVPDPLDQRRRLLTITPAGAELWSRLPDLTSIRTAAFDGIPPSQLAAATRVLNRAADRLESLNEQETPT